MTNHKILDTIRPAELTEEEWEQVMLDHRKEQAQDCRGEEARLNKVRLGRGQIPLGVAKPR